MRTENPQAFPTCKWCDEESVIKQGRIYLCQKHYRFYGMRVSAKRNGKEVPAYSQLDEMLNECKMVCVGCENKMVWRSCEDKILVLSLQHDRAGGMKFLCRSCNTRHAHMSGDSFYENKVPKHKKRCHSCGEVLLKSSFYKDVSRHDNLKSSCKICSNTKIINWRNANKNHYNEYQRNYRATNN